MLHYCFANAEEELLHVIRVNGSTCEEYQTAVEKVQNINYTDANGESFLHEAVRGKKSEIAMDLLRRGIDVNIENVNGYTAVYFAVVGHQWELLREILKFHPNVNLKSRRDGNSLLSALVFHFNGEGIRAAKELLKMGANPYAQNHKGISPLDLAIKIDNKELVEEFQQIPKPQQEEPERFYVPMRARGYYVVKLRDYHKYILVENATLQYLEDKIIDYSQICGGRKVQYKFEIAPVKDSLWTVIHCPEKMDFYNYHNLISWIVGLPEDRNVPDKTICVALHKTEERLSYYSVMDKQKFGDARMVGRFQNGESFSIYLPEAYKKNGNAQSFKDVLPIKSIVQYLSSCGFEKGYPDMLSEKPCKEIIVEMAVE